MVVNAIMTITVDQATLSSVAAPSAVNATRPATATAAMRADRCGSISEPTACSARGIDHMPSVDGYSASRSMTQARLTTASTASG